MSLKNTIKIIKIQSSISFQIDFIWSTLSTKIIFNSFGLFQSTLVLFGPFNPYWPYLVHIGPILSTLYHFVHFGPTRSTLILFDSFFPFWFTSVLFWPFSPFVHFDFIWPKLGFFGSILSTLAFSFHIGPIQSIVSTLVLICSFVLIQSTLVQFGALFGPLWSNLVHFVPFGPI